MGRYYGLMASLLCCQALAADGKQDYFEPGIPLPDDEGKALVLRACTGCHTLEGVPAFRKYWGYRHWLPMVETMIDHGARLDDEEKVAVTRYLARHYGTGE